MAAHLTRPVWVAAALVAWLAAPARAEALTDPTRPPAGLEETPSGAAPAPAGPVLQSVLIGPARRAAIISGQLVEQGGRWGDARVTRVTETQVVLQSAAGTQILFLYPGVDKKPVRAATRRGTTEAGK